MNNINFQKMLITADVAKKLLGTIKLNRKFKEPVVARYASDMKEGRWKEFTGETIKISNDGNVIDGEHRLRAVIRANASLWFHVITGLDGDVVDFLDTGSNRTAADAFVIAGFKNANRISSMIAAYHFLRSGLSSTGQKNNRLTNFQIKEVYIERPLFWDDACAKAGRWYSALNGLARPSYIGALYVYFSEISEIDAERFFSELCGNGLKTVPIQLLYKNLLSDYTGARNHMYLAIKRLKQI